jgi:signal transduction histidine kinase
MCQTQGMVRDRESARFLLPVLTAGFALLLVLLLVSGWVSIDSMRFVVSDASRFVSEQQATSRLIADVQSEEGNLSRVFYSLVSGRHVDSADLLKRLDALETAMRRTIDSGVAYSETTRWNNVRRAAERFIEEGRATIRSGRPPNESLVQSHQNLLDAVAELAAASFAPGGALNAEHERLTARIDYSLILLSVAVVVAIMGAIITVYFVNRMFFRLRWQAAELAQLSSRTMQDQEEAAGRLSREMHDHLGQTLSAIEANLVAMRNQRAFHAGRLEDCLGLVKDAVGNAREVSQLLRPPILDDFGLNASLTWLAENFAERTGKDVRCDLSFTGRLDRTSETQLFRIAQEALTNISRHADASEVRIQLRGVGSKVQLTVSDNGKGMTLHTGTVGMGLAGMRARARVAGGTMFVESRPGAGVYICAEVPLRETTYAPENSHSLS